MKPNKDSADDGSLASILKTWMRSFIRDNLDDMLPARVISYDDSANRAVVQPLVMVGTTDGQKVSRAHLQNIPVFRFGGGGFFIRFPIKPGDFGWLKANDRDISLIFQRGGLEDWPNTQRLHNFSDAMFFPDTLKDWAVDGENSHAVVLQSMDGAVCVALHDGKITMKAPLLEVDIPETMWKGNINQTGSLTGNGNVSFSGGSMQIQASTADIEIGHTDWEGDLVITGDDLAHNGKNVGSDHKHSDVVSGGDETGEPV